VRSKRGWGEGLYAASSALARQIEGGAPADMFISSDLDWMDYLQQHNLIQPATRKNLLGDRLVIKAAMRQFDCTHDPKD
jgi:molybdate transport system substrate-binding protein